jgi:hypothetical protein
VLKSKRTEECGTSGASEERLERKSLSSEAPDVPHSSVLLDFNTVNY